MIIKRTFFKIVRPCLYIIFGLQLVGCSTLKQENRTDVNLKAYCIYGDMAPGYEESTLFSALDETTIINVNCLRFTVAFKEMPKQFILSIRVTNDETAIKQLLSRLQSSDFRIKNVVLQN